MCQRKITHGHRGAAELLDDPEDEREIGVNMWVPNEADGLRWSKKWLMVK